MKQANTFVVDLLTTLQQEKFSPRGWWHFFQRAWDMSCQTAHTHPSLKRSWLHITLCMALLVFLGGIMTDILDGQVARYTQTQSKLGQIGDGEADFFLYLAIAIILIQNGALPLWLGLIMLLRFCIPLLAALVSYFLFAQPVRFGSTRWGKLAGLAQCIYLLVLLAPPQLSYFK